MDAFSQENIYCFLSNNNFYTVIYFDFYTGVYFSVIYSCFYTVIQQDLYTVPTELFIATLYVCVCESVCIKVCV